MSVSKVVPAQLSFLAIYSPSLGRTDDTFRDQVVFYYSRAARDRRRARHGEGTEADTEAEAREAENEKLRQIGLAQGMVGFAGDFADGEPVDHVETEKSRIVMRELEPGWWILASIDLTRLPVLSETPAQRTASPTPDARPAVEYSSREVSPPALLIQQLLRAHRIFQLHNGYSLSALYERFRRTRFCNTLERFWTRFANNWDVLLHGNPAADIYQGIKLSAGGELGIGVGEEEWGSGEREVFEDFASRTPGLVDMVVARFGDPSPYQVYPHTLSESGKKSAPPLPESQEPWLGRHVDPGPSDGVVFSGTGAIAKPSLRDVSDWLQQIYTYGEHAYGVRDSPSSDRRQRRRKRGATNDTPNGTQTEPEQTEKTAPRLQARRTSTREYPTIPPPIISAVERSLDKASAVADAGLTAGDSAEVKHAASTSTSDGWTKYLSLGYGSAWGPGSSKRPESARRTSDLLVHSQVRGVSPPEQHRRRLRADSEVRSNMQMIAPEPEGRRLEDRIRAQVNSENAGYFIIGLKGSLDDDADSQQDEDGDAQNEWNSRTLLRTLHVAVDKPPAPSRLTSNETDTVISTVEGQSNQLTRLRVVVYIHRPFIYAFLFSQRAESISMAPFYRDLHTFFAPLHRPLSTSTDPHKVATRVAAASAASPAVMGASTATAEHAPIYDLVHDPENLTLHTSIPNIPEPGTLGAEGLADTSIPGWTRVEAINVHSQILATVAETQKATAAGQLERTAKTSRGWWVVWMRVTAGHAISAGAAEGQTTLNDLHTNSLEESAITGTETTPNTDLDVLSVEPVKSRTASQLSGTTPASTADLDTKNHTDVNDAGSRVVVPALSTKSNPSTFREAFLIRRARDAAPASGSKSGTRSASGMWATMGLVGTNASVRAGGQQAGWGPARLAEGVGLDARKYVESLLSLNR